MYNMGASSKPMKYQELLQVIKGIVDMHSLSCSHLALIAIKTALTYARIYLYLLVLQSYLQFHSLSNQHFVDMVYAPCGPKNVVLSRKSTVLL